MGLWIPDGDTSQSKNVSLDPLTTSQALCVLDWHLFSLDVPTMQHIFSTYLDYPAILKEKFTPLFNGIYDQILDNKSKAVSGWCFTAVSKDSDEAVQKRFTLDPAIRAHLKELMAAAVKLVLSDPFLENKKWLTTHGKPIQTNDTTPSQITLKSANNKQVKAVLQDENTPSNAVYFNDQYYTINPIDPGHGLTIYPDSLVYSDNTITLEVNNKLSRFYSVYVTFYDASGDLIPFPKVAEKTYPDWAVIGFLPDAIRDVFQNQEKYPGEYAIGTVSSCWTVEGIPIPINKNTVTFKWADRAASVRIRFGSFGQSFGEKGIQSCLIGAELTLIMNYLIPMCMMLASVRLDNTGILQDIIKADKVLANILKGAFGILKAKQLYDKDYFGVLKDLGEKAAEIVAKLVRQKGLEKLAAYFEFKGEETADEDAIPFIGEAFIIASEAIDFANIAVTTAEIAVNPAIIDIKIKRVFNLTLEISAPPYGKYKKWPDGAATYHAIVKFDSKNSTYIQKGTISQALLDHSDQPFILMYPDLPAGGNFTVEIALYGSDNLCCASYNTPQAVQAKTQVLKGQFIHVQHPLDANTIYQQQRALVYEDAHYSLSPSPPSLLRTKASLGTQTGQDFTHLGKIEFDAWNDLLGYNWEPSTTAPWKLKEFCNIPDKVNDSMHFGTVSSGLSPRMVYNSFEHKAGETLPRRFWLDPSGGLNRLRTVIETPNIFELVGDTSWGIFPFPPIDLSFHPNGFIIAVAGGDAGGLMVLPLSVEFKDEHAPYASHPVPNGSRVGLISNAIAVSVTPDSRIMVLEGGDAPRCQSFDHSGNLVPSFIIIDTPLFEMNAMDTAGLNKMKKPNAAISFYFTAHKITFSDGATMQTLITDSKWVIHDQYGEASDQSWALIKNKDTIEVFTLTSNLSLNKDCTPLDISIELLGFIYIVSYLGTGDKPSDYNLDIYDPVGRHVCTTPNFNVESLVVDPWRNAFTLDYDPLIGKNGAEPKVSEWIPLETKN